MTRDDSSPNRAFVHSQLERLSEVERALLLQAVRDGRSAPNQHDAALGAAVARQHQRTALLTLPLYAGTAIGLAVGLGLVRDDSVGLFVFLLIVGLALFVGYGWWASTWRPLRRAERINLQILAGTAPHRSDGTSTRNRAFIAALSSTWLLSALIGGAVRGLVDVPIWIGLFTFVALAAALFIVIRRLTEDPPPSRR